MTEPATLLSLQVALQIVTAIGGLGTLGTLIVVAYRAGTWAGAFRAELAQMRIDLVRQNHTDDKLFALADQAVKVDECGRTHSRVDTGIARIDAAVIEHLVGHAGPHAG